jgi:hypothetical protein
MEQTHRTVSEAVTDIRYACLYGEMNERYWQRLDTVMNLVGALGGSSAIAGVLASNSTLSLVAGVAVAVASTLQLVLRPGNRSSGFRDTRREFLELEARAWNLSIVELDSARKRIEAQAPIGSRLLALPAWNASVRAIGREDLARPLNLAERAALLLA